MMFSLLYTIFFLSQFILISTLQPSQVITLSRGEMYNSNTSTKLYVDNVTVLNLSNLLLTPSNLQATFTGWIQTGTTTNLNKYESKIQIFNSASVNEKLLFFGNNSTHFILRQDISSSSSRCACVLSHQLSSTYRFVVSIQQNSSGLQLSLTLQLSDGTITNCSQTSPNFIDTTSKSYLLTFAIQKPSDQYIYNSEKMGDLSLIQNYAYVRDGTNSNLNEEKFLLGYTPAALQVLYFKFSYEMRDCNNCLIDSTENQIQAQSSLAFGVLESGGAGGYYIYKFTQNQVFSFSKSKVQFGQPSQNFYNSLNINNQSTSYNTMSLTLSFWLQFDSSVQSFSIFSYTFLGNSLQLVLKYNSTINSYQLILTYSSIDNILISTSSLSTNVSYHIAIQMNSVFTDVYINGIFNQRTTINLSTLFSQETTNGNFKIGGTNLPTSSIVQLSQVRMFSSSTIFSNQAATINNLIANCFTLVQERQQYTCILCISGYLLNDLGQCVPSCSANQLQLTQIAFCAPACSYRCQTCSTTNPLVCTSCGPQRILKGSTCLCVNGTFEDYISLNCKSVKKLTAGIEIGQFTFKNQNSLTITFKNTFTTAPQVLFSVLGYSVSNRLFGQFQVLASSITTTSMVVTPGVASGTSSAFYLHVQYIAYQSSQYFYSGQIGASSLLTTSGNYNITLGSYYSGKSPSLYNVHVFLGGYLCNAALLILPSTVCSVSIAVNPNKYSIDIMDNSLLDSTSPTVYYLVTPPYITSFNLGINYNTNSIQYDPLVLEKYFASQILLSPLNSLQTSLNPLDFDTMYSINSLSVVQLNFQFMKFQPNEISISGGNIYQNFEVYFNSLSQSSIGVQTTIFLDQFSDSVCGVKDYYTLKCLYCQNFGFDPSNSCTKCLNTFQLIGGNCVTPSGFYYDSTSNSNLPCNVSCSTCTSANSCSVCKNTLVQNVSTGLCECSQTNQWLDSSGNCQLCNSTCSTCTNGTSCSGCLSGLTLNPSTQLCECTGGLWFNSSTQTCSSCYFVCSSCVLQKSGSSENCTSCSGGRDLTATDGNCICSSNDQRLFQDDTRCSQGQQAILNAVMTDDYLNIQIDFGIAIQPMFTYTTGSNSVCQQLFDSVTLSLLGIGASCSISGSIVSITLDRTARILPGDQVNFVQNSLLYPYNSLSIQNFYRNSVQMSGLPLSSILKFNDYSLVQNYCKTQSISVESIQYDGKRGIKNLQWSVISIMPPDSNVQQALSEAIALLNQNQSQSLNIFLPMIQQSTEITIQLAWTLWIGQSGMQNANIYLEKKKFLQVNHTFLTPPPYYVYKNVTILYDFACKMCDSTGTTYQIYDPLSITVKNSQLGIDLSLQGYQSNNLTTTVNAFSMQSNNTYPIIATFTDESDTSIVEIDQLDLFIDPSKLIVKILGGSRYASYKNSINIKGFFKDLEIQNSTTNNQGIDISWQCINIATTTPCLNAQGQQLTLSQGNQYISIDDFTFSPYTVAEFKVTGTKTLNGSGANQVIRTSSDSVIIFITELDIPVLEVNLSEDLIIDPTINPNQLIHAEMIYPTVNTDVLYYSGAIIYNNTVVGVINFDYTLTRFQVWDYYDGFTSNNPNIQIRFSVYNPQYILPSLCTLNFILNFPPSSCQLSITSSNPSTNYSLIDLFTISLNNCQDVDSPISYQFFYYSIGNEYNYELSNYLQIQRQQLSDIGQNNSIETILPGGSIQLLVQAIDTRGAISNSTQTMNISYKSYTPNEFLSFVDQFIQQSFSLPPENQILHLNLLSQDILNLEINFQSVIQQLNQHKIIMINQLQLVSQQVLGTSSYFYQLAMQTVTVLLSSNQMNQLQLIPQSSQLSIINSNLQAISNRCVPSSANQVLYEKCLQDIYLTFKWTDSLSQIYNVANANLNAQYISITEVMSNMLNSQAYPNEDAVNFSGQNIKSISQRITQKNIINYIGMNSNKQKFRRILDSSTFQQTEQNQNTSIYDVSFNQYYANFYSQDTSFKNYTDQLSNLTKKPISNYVVLNPKIRDLQTNQSFNPQNGAIHYFDILNHDQNLTCFAKTDESSTWLKQSCMTRVNNQTNQIQCVCPDLSPTTIIQDIEDLLLNNKNIDTAFSGEGLSNLSNFTNFYEYLVFWVVLGQTILFICLVFFGMKLDTEFLYKNVPFALRKGENSAQAKIAPVKDNTTKSKFQKFKRNEGVTQIITSEKDVKGVGENQNSVKKLISQKNIKISDIDEKPELVSSDKQSKENDNKSGKGFSSNRSSSRGFMKQIDSDHTSLNNPSAQTKTTALLSRKFLQPIKKRTLKVAQFGFEQDLQYSSDKQITQPSSLQSIGQFKSIHQDQKKISDPQIESRLTSQESDNNILNLQKTNPIKQPSITFVFDQNTEESPPKPNQNPSQIDQIKLNQISDANGIDTANNDKEKVTTQNTIQTATTSGNITENPIFKRKSKKEQGINVENQITDTEKEKLSKINKIIYFAHFHDFISIFLVYNYEISRAARFVLYYLRYQHTLAMSILFGVDKSFVQKVFVSFASSLIIFIVCILIETLLTSRRFLKKIGLLFSLSIALFYVYIILSIVSGQQPGESNQFISTYAYFLIMDIAILQTLTALLFGYFAKNVVYKQRSEEDCFKKLFDLLKLNVIVNALIK